MWHGLMGVGDLNGLIKRNTITFPYCQFSICSSVSLLLDKKEHYMFVFISCDANVDLGDMKGGDPHRNLSLTSHQLSTYFKHQPRVKFRVGKVRLSSLVFCGMHEWSSLGVARLKGIVRMFAQFHLGSDSVVSFLFFHCSS